MQQETTPSSQSRIGMTAPGESLFGSVDAMSYTPRFLAATFLSRGQGEFGSVGS